MQLFEFVRQFEMKNHGMSQVAGLAKVQLSLRMNLDA